MTASGTTDVFGAADKRRTFCVSIAAEGARQRVPCKYQRARAPRAVNRKRLFGGGAAVECARLLTLSGLTVPRYCPLPAIPHARWTSPPDRYTRPQSTGPCAHA